MKYIQFALLSILVSYSVAGQNKIETTGNVGIGTTNPLEKLQIGNNGFTFHDGGHKVIAFGYAPWPFYDLNGNGLEGEVRFDAVNGSLHLGVGSNDGAYPSRDFNIINNGNIGIGTSAPIEKLHVSYGNLLLQGDSGNSDLSILFNDDDTDNKYIINADPSYENLNFTANSNRAITIDSSTGSVGVKLSDGTISSGKWTGYADLVVTGGNSSIHANRFGWIPSDNFSHGTNDNLKIAHYGLSVFGDQVGTLPKAPKVGVSGYYGLKFFTSGKERINITNTGNVGIGTSNPDGKLHVQNGSTGGIPHSFSDITLEHNDNSMISILTPSNKVGYFGFADEDDGWVAGMQYSHSSNAMLFRVNNHNSDVIINSSGNVGIGTTNPASKLEVNGDISLVRSKKIKFLETVGGDDRAYIKSTNGENGDYNSLIFAVGAGDESMFINSNGNVGIGTPDTQDFKLGVNGDIAATKIKVALYDNWPDYVFEDAYELPTLKEVENHINEKGHLQNVPSAKEIGENGFFLEEMDSKLLQKIEELTLYTIAQEKRIEEQNETNRKMQEQLLELSKRLEQLESK